MALLFVTLALAGDELAEIRIPPDAEERAVIFRPWRLVKTKKRYFVDGEAVGERKFYADGQLADERLYKNRKLHGIWRQFYPDGRLFAERPFRDGQMDGTFRFWDESGKLLGESVIKKGTGVLREYPNSPLLSDDAEWHYVDGKKHGEQIRWGRYKGCTGLGYSISEYNEDALDGWVVTRDEDGTLLSFGHLRNNRSHGVSRKFSRDGELLAGFPEYHINGDEVAETRFMEAAKTDKVLAETLTHSPERTEKPPPYDGPRREIPDKP